MISLAFLTAITFSTFSMALLKVALIAVEGSMRFDLVEALPTLVGRGLTTTVAFLEPVISTALFSINLERLHNGECFLLLLGFSSLSFLSTTGALMLLPASSLPGNIRYSWLISLSLIMTLDFFSFSMIASTFLPGRALAADCLISTLLFLALSQSSSCSATDADEAPRRLLTPLARALTSRFKSPLEIIVLRFELAMEALAEPHAERG